MKSELVYLEESLKRARRIHEILVLLCVICFFAFASTSIPEGGGKFTGSLFGVSLDSPILISVGGLFLIPITCMLLGAYLGHLRKLAATKWVEEETQQAQQDILQSFPWVVLFSGWEGIALTVASLLFLPATAAYPAQELPLARFLVALPAIYVCWQAIRLRDVLQYKLQCNSQKRC